jgi:hypothetical protein
MKISVSGVNLTAEKTITFLIERLFELLEVSIHLKSQISK